jgi:hypothetical protein
MNDELTFSAAILATNKGPLKPVAKISPRTKSPTTLSYVSLPILSTKQHLITPKEVGPGK